MTLSADNPIELVYGATDELIEDAFYLSEILQDHSLWNTHRLRTTEGGPHRHVDDIWVRCLNWSVMQSNPEAFNSKHFSSWYPVADGRLAYAKLVVDGIFRNARGIELGGVLITRIPAGCCVLPHRDEGWHARYYEKFAFQIQANDLQEFCFDRTRLVTRPGDIFTFDNQYSHWVTNPSSEDRITMIVCVRRE